MGNHRLFGQRARANHDHMGEQPVHRRRRIGHAEILPVQLRDTVRARIAGLPALDSRRRAHRHVLPNNNAYSNTYPVPLLHTDTYTHTNAHPVPFLHTDTHTHANANHGSGHAYADAYVPTVHRVHGDK